MAQLAKKAVDYTAGIFFVDDENVKRKQEEAAKDPPLATKLTYKRYEDAENNGNNYDAAARGSTDGNKHQDFTLSEDTYKDDFVIGGDLSQKSPS